jgi:hypothetical protein
VPNPSTVEIRRGSADIEQVMRDLMSLTKLNFSAAVTVVSHSQTTMTRQSALRSKPRRCERSGVVSSNGGSIHACCTRTKAAVTGLIGARIDFRRSGPSLR